MIEYFLENNFQDSDSLILFYKDHICESLMYQDPKIIKLVTNKLIKNIESYAQNNTVIYKNMLPVFTRKELSNKEDWLSKSVDKNRIANQNTSGSTTGESFFFYNDRKHIDFVQRKSEFDTILKEYDLYNKPLKILNLFKHPYNPKPESFFLKTVNYSNHPFHSYMAKESETIFVSWDGYVENSEDWHKKLLDLLSQIKVDIILGSGPVFNVLCRYIKKNNFKHFFATLLSHTSEFPIINDFKFLQSNGNISLYCDHMRCWDGGASFFTCKSGTYHLNDNFAWTIQGEDNKFISTDYFNMVAPFINYYNGDLCEIKENYELCSCGRYYRPFKMLQNRPFALKGTSKLTDIKQQISQLSFKNDLIQIQFENLSVIISSSRNLETVEKEILQNILKEYEIFWK